MLPASRARPGIISRSSVDSAAMNRPPAPVRRTIALLLVAVLLSFLLPSLALGHADLVTATPADASTVTEPVAEVAGTYAEAMTPDGSSLVVKDANGDVVASGTVDPADDTRMVAVPTTPLGDGEYRVESTAVATDGHIEHATWTFTVAIPPTPAPTPSTPSLAPSSSPAAEITPSPEPASPSPSIVPKPGAIGRGRLDWQRQRRPPSDRRRADRPRGRGRLPVHPARSPVRPGVSGGLVRTFGPRIGGAVGFAALIAIIGPATVVAHSLNATYESRLPLAVYLVGAALTVALSFAFVIVRDVRAAPPLLDGLGSMPPAPIRLTLRTLGLIGWLWIVAQGIAGNESDGAVATLFLWVYGWVGLAMVCAVIGPAWQFLDPFSTLHDLAAALLRALHVQGWAPAEYPTWLGRWPAVIGFGFFVWLELVIQAGPSTLFIVLVAYTALTLVMMAQFGRDEWRSQGETFTVWFRLLGRLAHWRLVDEDGRIETRAFGSGLLEPGWTPADVTLAAVGVSSIIFDGLSQTQAFFDLFGAPGIPGRTVLLVAFLGIVVLLAFLVARTVGLGAIGAGLLPIAVGYLIAHYLTYLLIDGQRIVIAISDPFQRGWNLFDTAFFEPSGAWLPPGLIWTIQLAAVVGGHMLGAWGGHVVAVQDAPPGLTTQALRRRQIPLAVVMVTLTTVTLWSLGQAIVASPQAADGAAQTGVVASAPDGIH